MDTTLRELADLALRWTHVVAAIMWIGNSLLFNWLDRNLRPSPTPAAGEQGEIWLLHSGGFYHAAKTQLLGSALPRPLHWFKWQAYTTWLSGACLLIVVYYLGGAALLLPPGSPLSPRAAVAVGAGAIVASLVVYNALCATPLLRSPATMAAIGLAWIAGLAYGLTQVFSARAAFLHIGATLGTIMAGNVFLTIIPSQRQLVAAVAAGRGADPRLAGQAKRRSIHNNYLTFPVIALMLSGHFPELYGAPWSWLVLLVIVLAGAGVRHWMNVRFTRPRWIPALAATAAAALGALYFVAARPLAPTPAAAATSAGPVTFAEAQAVVQKRCAVCHSATAADRTFGAAPAGVAFDRPEQIRALAPRIRVRAVVTRTMPPGNKTWITPEERAVLGRWVEEGARLR
ncbi:MAG TPA: urate hydroxylase PuuD [Longimicrobiales bacterium]|nr:urate hydroxylase PuuD [Longimicrobiales bacterium]